LFGDRGLVVDVGCRVTADDAGVAVAGEDLLACPAGSAPPLAGVDPHDWFRVAAAAVSEATLAVMFVAAGLALRDDGRASGRLADTRERAQRLSRRCMERLRHGEPNEI
jgi:hypothetical protein